MGTQLIFCVETNKQTKSDYIYINSVIRWFYQDLPANIKVSTVYMNNKYNYNSNKVKKEISNYEKQYRAASKNNHSEVIYCFDCDDYDIKAEDKVFLKTAREYCENNGCRFVWFCKDIEQVFLRERINDNEKKVRAEVFQRKKMIRNLNFSIFESDSYQVYKSNLGLVLNEFLARR